MKKHIFASLFVVTCLTSGYCQNLRFGIFVNPSISWMKSDVSKIEPTGSRLGVNAGLMIDKFFAEHYAFTTGISIHTMGATINYKESTRLRLSDSTRTLGPNTQVGYKLQYIHVPLALKFRTPEIGYVTIFAQLGLDPMINVKAQADIKSKDISNDGVGDEINTFYMGYHISAGMEYKIVGNTALMAGLTYMNGFSDITDNGGANSEKTVLHCFELRIGLIF